MQAILQADQRRPTENATATAAAQFGAPGSFSVTGFLARIGGRGGVVVLAADGTLRISPRSVVNETDRRDLRDHKAEIASALADAESF